MSLGPPGGIKDSAVRVCAVNVDYFKQCVGRW